MAARSSCVALSPRAPHRIRTYAALRVSRQSLARFPLGTIPQLLSSNSTPPAEVGDLRNFLRDFVASALPALWRGHGRDGKIYGCGVIPMFLLRFFVAVGPLPLTGCAPARRRIRVLSLRRHSAAPRSAHTSAAICDALSDHHATGPVHHCSPHARFCDRLPLKSHSAPRPPQTPAASS